VRGTAAVAAPPEVIVAVGEAATTFGVAGIDGFAEARVDVVVDVVEAAAVVEGLTPDAGVGVLMGRGWDIGVSYRIW
jgi:hypothetical protein